MKHVTIYDEVVFEIGRKYNFSVETTTKLLLEVDKLTEEELRDLDYVEDEKDVQKNIELYINYRLKVTILFLIFKHINN